MNRKTRLCLHLTWHDDSQTLSYFVESNDGEGRWELWSDGDSLPLSGFSGAVEELKQAFIATMAAPSPSMSRSSD